VYPGTWRAEPEPQWRAENKSRGKPIEWMILLPPRARLRRRIETHSSGKAFGQSPYRGDMEAHLLILGRLHSNAAECIRLAEAARTSAHKSLFIEMAERWLTLAERAEQTRG
jgi:hypothetical protein